MKPYVIEKYARGRSTNLYLLYWHQWEGGGRWMRSREKVATLNRRTGKVQIATNVPKDGFFCWSHRNKNHGDTVYYYDFETLWEVNQSHLMPYTSMLVRDGYDAVSIASILFLL